MGCGHIASCSHILHLTTPPYQSSPRYLTARRNRNEQFLPNASNDTRRLILEQRSFLTKQADDLQPTIEKSLASDLATLANDHRDRVRVASADGLSPALHAALRKLAGSKLGHGHLMHAHDGKIVITSALGANYLREGFNSILDLVPKAEKIK